MRNFFRKKLSEFRNTDGDQPIHEFLADTVATSEFAELYARQIGAFAPALPKDFGLGDDFNKAMRLLMSSATTTSTAFIAACTALGGVIANLKASGDPSIKTHLDTIDTHLSKLDAEEAATESAEATTQAGLQAIIDGANSAGASVGSSGTSGALSPTVSALDVATGPVAGGTTVTVTGKGFTGANAVMFGTQSASNVNVINDTQVSAVSPAATAAGAVDVTVVTPIGTSAAVTADQFTYA